MKMKMKINNKIIFSLIVVLFFGIGIVSASVYSTEAEKWFAKNCVEGRHAPKRLDAAVCDLRERIMALENSPTWDEERIAALEARVAALENSTQLCSATLCQNFNSYLDGSIIGQDDWFNRENGTAWIVQNSIVQEGSKALSNFNSSGESIITKNTGTALTDGRQSFYVKPENRLNWSSYHIPNFQLGMFQGSWDGSSRITVGFGIDGQVSYVNASTDTRVNFGAYNDNAWNLLDIEWRSSDKTARYKLNNGLWTDWIPFTGGAAFIGFDTVGLDGANLGTGGVYVDDLH